MSSEYERFLAQLDRNERISNIVIPALVGLTVFSIIFTAISCFFSSRLASFSVIATAIITVVTAAVIQIDIGRIHRDVIKMRMYQR